MAWTLPEYTYDTLCTASTVDYTMASTHSHTGCIMPPYDIPLLFATMIDDDSTPNRYDEPRRRCAYCGTNPLLCEYDNGKCPNCRGPMND